MKLKSKHDLGVRILTGSEAVREFGDPHDPEQMRKRTADAFQHIRDLFAEQGLLMTNLMRENKGDEPS